MPVPGPRLVVALVALTAFAGCAPNSTLSPTPSTSPAAIQPGSLVIVGRIMTMAEPAIAEALLIEDGVVTAVGSRDAVLALAGDEVPIIDIGQHMPQIGVYGPAPFDCWTTGYSGWPPATRPTPTTAGSPRRPRRCRARRATPLTRPPRGARGRRPWPRPPRPLPRGR